MNPFHCMYMLIPGALKSALLSATYEIHSDGLAYGLGVIHATDKDLTL